MLIFRGKMREITIFRDLNHFTQRSKTEVKSETPCKWNKYYRFALLLKQSHTKKVLICFPHPLAGISGTLPISCS